MTKKEVQKYLSNYAYDEELFVIWWDKEFLNYDGDNPITKEEWKEILDRLDGYGFDTVNESIFYIMEEELANIREK